MVTLFWHSGKKNQSGESGTGEKTSLMSKKQLKKIVFREQLTFFIVFKHVTNVSVACKEIPFLSLSFQVIGNREEEVMLRMGFL